MTQNPNMTDHHGTKLKSHAPPKPLPISRRRYVQGGGKREENKSAELDLPVVLPESELFLGNLLAIDFTTNFLPDLQLQVWDEQFAKKMIARVQGFFTAFSEEPHVPPFPTTTLIFDFWLSDLISGDVDELTTIH